MKPEKTKDETADEKSRRSFLRTASIAAVASTGLAGVSAAGKKKKRRKKKKKKEVPACENSEGAAPEKNPHCKGKKKKKEKY